MRKEIDIRTYTGRPTGLVKTTTSVLQLHLKSGWVAYRVGTKSGWYVFNRMRRYKKLGSRWAVGFSMTFITAIRKAKKDYHIKIPTDKWTPLTIKHYNFTNVTDTDILNYLLTKIQDNENRRV